MAEDIVKASLEAMGGKKAFDDVQSFAVKANMSTPMGDLAMDMKTADDQRFLLMQVLPGMGESSAGSNGKIGWTKSPMGYQLLEQEEMKQANNQSNLYRMVFNVNEDFPTMETVDKVTFNDAEAYKVKMVSKDPEQPTQFGFFGVDSKLMQGLEISQDGPMGPMTVTITFGDWKKFDALTLFTKLSIDQGGIQMGPMNITEVELNKVDPSVFELPPEVKELVEKKAEAPASQPAPLPETPSSAPKPE